MHNRKLQILVKLLERAEAEAHFWDVVKLTDIRTQVEGALSS